MSNRASSGSRATSELDVAEEVARALAAAIRSVNHELPRDMHLEERADTVLMGEGRRIDSLGLVGFLVAVEEEMRLHCKLEVSLGDGDMLAGHQAEVWRLKDLAIYLQGKLGQSRTSLHAEAFSCSP